MTSKYESWTTADILTEIKRIQQKNRDSGTQHSKSIAINDLKLLINILRRRGL